jgi:hypothetical protein
VLVRGGQHGFWTGKTRFGEKHRTEVTEVTEGGIEVGEISTLRTAWLAGEKRRERGESIAQRSQRGELSLERISPLRTAWLAGGKRRASGKSIAQRSRRSQRGESSLERISTLRTAWLAAGNDAKEGKASDGQVLAIDQPLNTVLKACFTEID